MTEELGENFGYTTEAMPSVLMRHERVEASPGNPTVHIFGLGYRASYLSGSPEISDTHTEMLWVNKETFKLEDYFTGGWLKGVKDYLHT